MPVVGVTLYPTMETVTNLVRSIVRDDMAGATGTVGEGQVFVDNLALSVTLGNYFNSSVRELARNLRLSASPTLIRDNYLLEGLPVVNGPLGSAVPDPSVQCNLSFTGFFDGSQVWPNFTLPADCFQVDVVWERQNNTNSNFMPMTQPARALSGCNQGVLNGEWEWRQDGIWMRGALQSFDLRLRYQMKLQDMYTTGVDLTQTYIPIIDCEEALAYLIAKRIATRQGSPLLPQIAQDAQNAVGLLVAEEVKREQGKNYDVPEFGTEEITLM